MLKLNYGIIVSLFFYFFIKGVRVIFLINYFINYTCGYCKKHVYMYTYQYIHLVSVSVVV